MRCDVIECRQIVLVRSNGNGWNVNNCWTLSFVLHFGLDMFDVLPRNNM